MDKNDFISIVVPVYNEEGNIIKLVNEILKYVTCYNKYEILLIDDGSKDKTLTHIKTLNANNSSIRYLSFSRNFGHQAALKAGLDYSLGDCVISMDGDMQHPPVMIPDLIKNWKEGNDVVITLRQDDKKVGFFKKQTSSLFYKLLNSIADIELKEGSADFRLLDRKVVDVIKQLPENPIFFRGMVSWLGFKQKEIPYVPEARFTGVSKYSLKKMINFSLEGITSFSMKPLRIASFIGLLSASLSFIYGCYILYIKIVLHNAVEGWSSLMSMVVFFGGLQLLMIGLLGEYLGKLFIESKRRPSYIIKEKNIE